MNYVKSFDLFGVQAMQIPSITGSGAPTTATKGAVGCLYMDTTTGDLYKCTAAASGVYTWEKIVVSSNSSQNGDQITLKSPDGTEWKITVSDSGVITATKVTSGGDSGETDDTATFESYTIFVPENVSDEWNTGGSGNTTQAKTLNVSTAEFLELFYDGFVSTQPSGVTVTKTSIGKDQSGQYDMWEYDFCPTNYSRTILLSSGMHTYELSASFGLANFIGHLYTDTGNDAFDYIRNNVRVKIIPVVNPWGFNQSPKTYGNVNGVNPNRNFDLDGQWSEFEVYSADSSASNYNEWNVKGDSPFSEAEVINLAKWAIDNWEAEFWIDCHTGVGYDDKDLWVYYSSDSAILDRINGGISAIETWFKETYGVDCVTTRTIDNEGSIRLHWAEKVAGIPGMTLEQAPARTTFGTANNNDSGDISNYSTNISTFVQEFLLEKYRNTETVAIQSISLADVVVPYGTPSITVTATVTPDTTTQGKFEWTSSDETVCKVYGGSEKAIVVQTGYGSATITCRNRYSGSVIATCTVTCEEPTVETLELSATSGSINAFNAVPAENAARVFTDYISVTPSTTLNLDNENGYFIKAFEYTDDGRYLGSTVYIGSLSATTASGVLDGSAGKIRVLMKKQDGADFTAEEINNTYISVNGQRHKLSYVESIETPTTFDIVVEPGTISASTDFPGTNTDSETRYRTRDYIAVNDGDTLTLNGETIKFAGRIYQINNYYCTDGTSGWNTVANVSKNSNTDVNRMRFVFSNAEDTTAVLDASAFDGVTITHEPTGFTYRLVVSA